MEPWQIIVGDALAVLRTLGDGAFQTAITSPPYWSLRDYGTGTWEGGDDPACDHKGPPHQTRTGFNERYFGRPSAPGNAQDAVTQPYRDLCGKCGARRVDLQLGLEKCPDCFAWARGAPGSCSVGGCYVCKMTCVFREVRRVLRDDGTLWVNVASSFASGNVPGWKAKDLVNTPCYLAESLRCDGWYLRSEIQLTKLSPMPESCRDRPTRATEKLYLFAKRGAYFYDAEAERVAVSPVTLNRDQYTRITATHEEEQYAARHDHETISNPAGRNLWDYWDCDDSDLPPAVWQWRPEPQKRGSKHYATYPLWLPLRCVRLGTSAKGCCPRCSAPWRRVVERKGRYQDAEYRGIEPSPRMADGEGVRRDYGTAATGLGKPGWREFPEPTSSTLGWQQGCKCPPHEPRPCAVLDMFCGTGTSGVAARLLGRTFTGIELSAPYAQIARERLASACPLDDAAFARTPSPQPSPGLFDGGQP